MRRGPLLPSLPRRVWVLFAGDLLSFVGNGLVLPFLIIYFHRVRHFALPTAGLVLSTIALAGFFGTVVTGGLVDRIGPRRTLLLSQIDAAAGAGTLAFVHSPWQAFVAAAIYGLGASGYWPAMQSLLATSVRPEERDGAFSLHFMALNAGIGLGALLGGVSVSLAHPGSFVAVFLVDAASFLAFAIVITRMRSLGAARTPRREGLTPRAGYAEVLRDGVFLRICLVMALLITVGTGQLTSGFPAFATGRGHASTHVVGLAFGANTLVIVVLQLWALRAMKGHRRTRLVMGTCLMWALCWALTLASGLHGGGTLSDAGFVLALSAFALGETAMAPSIPALVNHLAPEHLRGRYNALYSLSFSSGFVLGPAIAGFALGAGAGPAFFGALLVGCGAVATLWRWLEKQIPEDANLIQPTEAEILEVGGLDPQTETGTLGSGEGAVRDDAVPQPERNF